MDNPKNFQMTQRHEVPRDFSGAIVLVKSLIETRNFRKEMLEAEAVKVAFEIIGDAVTHSDMSAERLEGVSTLGKASEVSVPISKRVRPILERALLRDLPQIGEWGNADDRKYLAKGIEFSRAPWIGRYAAVELARADIAEKLARDAWANLAVGHAANLADVLREVAWALDEQLSKLGDSTDLAYRKLQRISEALTTSLPTADIPLGEGFGKAFSLLVRPAGGSKGSETRKLREDAAIRVLDFLFQILRLRFESIFDSDFYRTVGAVRGWWSPARPPEEVEQITDRIAALAVNGLHFLARQGVKDNNLRQALVNALSVGRVNAIAGRVASNDPSLAPEISQWLSTGQELAAVQSNESMKESNESVVDELLARLLLAIHDQDGGARSLSVAAETIEVFEPSQAATLRLSAGRLEVIEQWALSIGAKRKLLVQGNKSDVVLYDPALHDSPSALQRGAQVRIVTPSVIRFLEGRPATIIIKAIVDQK